MKEIITLLKIWAKDVWLSEDEYNETEITRVKEIVFDRAKQFLQWLIDNWHIEVIDSEKKAWPELNDYIKYIATTEDPIKTLSSLIK